MTRLSAFSALLLPALASGAAAAPSFKAAPESEKSGGDGGGWSAFVPIDPEAAPPWAQGVLEFLAGNYGYIGVAAVLLMLYLFARGSGGDDEASDAGSGDEDDFFEPEDVRNYRGGSR